MSDNTFEGISKTGSIQEALALAIKTAKETLRTDAIDWELKTLKGRDGGFVLEQKVKVTIYAKSVQLGK
jgi:hypothetical protein